MALEWILSYLCLGLVVGFIAGLLGVGGGGIIVPVVTYLLLQQGIATNKVMHLALGTSMCCMIITSFSSLLAHYKHGQIIWDIVGKMVWGIITGTFISTFIAAYLHSVLLAVIFISLTSMFTTRYGVIAAHYLPTSILKKIFALLLIGLSLKILFSLI